MSIEKKYLKTKNECKVSFVIPKESAELFKTASVVGCFNEWNPATHEMKKNKKSGEFKLEISLPANATYQFRYLCDGTVWHNDEAADGYTKTEFGDADNCVLSL